MALYTYWLNVIHPGQLLPRQRCVYLDIDGKTERLGPGWVDRRSTYATFLDPFDLIATFRRRPSHEKFWESPTNEQWPEVQGRGVKHVGGHSYAVLQQDELETFKRAGDHV